MNKEFLASINSAVDSKEEFFIADFGPKKIKIFFEDQACDWVWNYKYIYQKEALDIRSETNSSLDIKKIALINYFYTFIVRDILNLNNYISPTIKSVLDIGAGIGLFDLFLNQILEHKTSFDLIEVDKLDEIEHVTNNPANTKKLKKNIQINPVITLKKLMVANSAKSINIIESQSTKQYFHKKYDLILSFRSWGYLYDLSLYEEFVIKTLNPDGVVITDLSIFDDSIDKFYSLFRDVTLINESPNNKRFLGQTLR
jgi:hypothetical protein